MVSRIKVLIPRKLLFTLGLLLVSISSVSQEDIFNRVEHHYADNQGIKIHYVSAGQGPVLVMLHGFPDFWYTWRFLMEELSKDYKVVAVDLRGYNKSDQPQNVQDYSMGILMKDIIAVIDDLNVDKATIIANDWGGAIAWQLAMYYPNRIERYVACNMPHPNGMRQFLRKEPQTAQYVQELKTQGLNNNITSQSLVEIHPWLNEIERQRYLSAFNNSSINGMLNYYRANYPKVDRVEKKEQGKVDPVKEKKQGKIIKKVKCPVLIIYGLKDRALPPGMLNNTWDWIDNDLTIITIPEAGHFVQQQAPEKTTNAIKFWLSHH